MYQAGQIVAKYKNEAECMNIVLSGELGQFDRINSNKTDGLTPNKILLPIDTFGEECMTQEVIEEATVKAMRKSIVLQLYKKDLIEVISHVKVVVTGDK